MAGEHRGPRPTSLRTVVVRVRHLAPGLLSTTRDPLTLARGTQIDVQDFMGVADALSEQAPTEAARRLMGVGELLPGWYEDWVLFERERFRQLRMSALDRVASRLLEQGDLPLALAAAQCCAQLEPLRETPHRILVRIHFAAGDRVEALRVYEDFRRRSIEEFGLAPDSAFDDLVRPLLQERRARSRGPGAHPSGLRPPGRHPPGQRPPGQRPPGQRPSGP